MYNTEQEKFWANEFGTEYIERNKGEQLLASNLNFFSKALQQAGRIESCIEFGANIGMNLKAIEINQNAANILGDFIGKDNVYSGSIFEHKVESKVQLSLIKGVLIHINPNMLQKVYEQLYNSSEKFILIAEYYNPTPVTLNYRGHEDRLFKRDFAGEFLDKYQDTELIDYGFSYRRDSAFPQDDITWFLIKKK
jgi:spore coat polysaccharide biosynthesis protein SpsF